jgi:hypothetical protein
MISSVERPSDRARRLGHSIARSGGASIEHLEGIGANARDGTKSQVRVAQKANPDLVQPSARERISTKDTAMTMAIWPLMRLGKSQRKLRLRKPRRLA